MRHILTRLLFCAVFWGGFCAVPAAADSPYTVAGVHVDASGSSTSEARNAAIAAGRADAWQTLFRRLARQQDWARQPAPSPDQLQKLISSYFPVGERRSTTRYVAEVTYIFNPGAVARLMQSAGVAFTSASSHRVLVVPLAPSYGKASAWTAALGNPRLSGGVVPYSLPVGDAQDMNRLTGVHFETARWADLAEVAARRGAGEAVLILLSPEGKKLKITLRRLGPNGMPVKNSTEVALAPGAAAPASYPQAADAAIKAMEDLWKAHSVLDNSQRGHITVGVAADTLQQFGALEKLLAGVPNVSGTSVVALDVGAAQLTLSYIGTLDQLRDALTQAGLRLDHDAAGWRLAVAEVP
ncbi:MAG: DUF2066 domain-containing protein [Rhizomicrobium sp.]